MTGCPDEAQIQRYVDGHCAAEDAATIEAHRSACATCAAAIHLAGEDDVILGDLRRALTSGLTPVQEPRAGLPGLSRYRIVRRLGGGGMGIVYEAEQRNPARRVALKVLRTGLVTPEARRRFELEGEALARLDHPGIARIYDAGTYDLAGEAQPFFAMELVDGPALDAWVDARKPTMRARLELFVRVCEAVEHAHHRGVVHRDLKPSNILVTDDGGPKVVDFGVARLIDRAGEDLLLTLPDQQIGTLPYMSPEQIRGDRDAIDVRSDVWALGVVLFELLSDRLPHDFGGTSRTEAARIIAERDPPRLRAIGTAVDSELETIVAKALRLDATMRFVSVGALREDLCRHLRHEPILSRPPSAGYALRKFARRHRILVGAIAVVVSGLVLGLIVVGRARHHAELQASRAGAVADILREVLLQADPNQVRGSEPTISDAVREAEVRMQRHAPDDAWVRGVVWHTLGQVQLGLGRFDDAERNLNAGLAAFELVRPDSADVASVLRDLVTLALNRGQFAAVEGQVRRALQLVDALGLERSLRASFLNLLGLAHQAEGRLVEAEESLTDALAIWESIEGEAGANVGNVLANLGLVQSRSGDLDAALVTYQRSLSVLRSGLDEAHPLVAATLGKIGAVYLRQGEFDAAEAALRQALQLGEERLGVEHPDLTSSYLNLGGLLRRRDRAEAAIGPLESGLRAARRGGADHPHVQAALSRLAGARADSGDVAGATADLRELQELLLRAGSAAQAKAVGERLEALARSREDRP